MIKHMGRDLVHACRSLAKARAFTVVCVVSLGIGMVPVIAVPFGTRIFTTPPTGVRTEGLIELVTTRVGSVRATDEWSYPDFMDLRESATGLALTGWTMGSSVVSLVGPDGAATTVPTMYVAPDYFRTIGVPLAAGTGFQETAGPEVVLGYRFWQVHLDADPAIVGRTLTIGRVPHTVVGIAPESFGGMLGFHQASLFAPLSRHPTVLADDRVRFDRAITWVRIHGRLQPGVDLAQAHASVSGVTARLAEEYTATNEFRSGTVMPYHAMGSLQGVDLSVVLAVVQTVAMLPLLVVCLNISGMFQVRSAIRERDLSIRQAIGASRARLMQSLLAEAVVLAALGAGVASLVIFNLPQVISRMVAEPIPAHWQQALRPDVSILLICGAASLATSLVFGWLPALRFSRPQILTVLKDDTGGGGIRAGRVHRLTTALQAAIAVPLLVMSGMSLDRVRSTATSEIGFDADRIYAAPLDVETAFDLRSAVANLEAAGGVESVTVADGLPLDFRYRMGRVSLTTESTDESRVVPVHVTRVGDRYLETMGIALIRGRGFGGEDGRGTATVTVISKTLADRLFPGADPGDAVGRSINFGVPDADGRQQTLTIVGVTQDFPTAQMSTDREQLLLTLAQYSDVRGDSVPVWDDRSGLAHVMLVARSAAGESAVKMTGVVDRVVREFDPTFDPATIVTGTGLRRFSMDDFLKQAAVSGISGGIVLLLAALGIYGVVGMMVATRTREIAVRVTLGASRARVIRMVVSDVVRLVVPGVVVGVLIAIALVRTNGGLLGLPLSGVESVAYVVGAAVALLVAVGAGIPPARRAASVQPMVAMRTD